MPKYSIVIGVLDHFKTETLPCITSILKYTDLENVEIIIVDNGSSDFQTKDYIEGLISDGLPFKYIYSKTALGYSGANNAGLKQATGDYLILLNNDTILLDQPKNKWISDLEFPFTVNEKCGITGPILGYSDPADANFLIFFCVCISRKCFESVGYLDEAFREGGGEDTAYSIEAVRKGFELIQVPYQQETTCNGEYICGGYPIWHAGEATVHGLGLDKWKVIFDRNSQILRERYNKKYILEQQDSFIYDEIFTKNGYAVQENEIKGKNVIDIGANVGMFSIFISKFKPKYTLTIEPDKDNFNKLRENLKCFGIKFIGGIHSAVTSSENKVIFLENEGGLTKITESNTGREVKTTTLQSLVDKYYRDDNDMILKIDCEGSEYDIFLNASKELIGRFEYIYAEIHDENTIIDEHNMTLAQYICSLGFEIMPNTAVMWCNYGRHQNQIYKFKRIKSNIPKKGIEVTAVVSSKGRNWTTLPSTILAICNQSYKPKHIIIYDDGDFKKDLDKDPTYSHLFKIMTHSGISWQYMYGDRRGQVANHIRSLKDAPTEMIWRCDDDNVPEYNVLEKLVSHVTDRVGAVGGCVINNYEPVPSIASNSIEDIYLGMNRQWFLHPKDAEPEDVDHLYSSFLYRKDIAEYPTNLGLQNFREETFLTYGIKRKGYEVIFDPTAITWHMSNPEGGCRSNKETSYAADQQVFASKMIEWGIKPNEYSFVVLENGIGDHYSFKNLLPQYFEKNQDKKHIFFVTYPEVFKDIDGITLASLQEGKNLLGDISRFNVYKAIADLGWDKTLEYAYKHIYGLKTSSSKTWVEGVGETIIISPYSQNPSHAKSYTYWKELVELLKKTGYRIIQIGRSNEPRLDGVDDFYNNSSLAHIEKLITDCRMWIGVDNFLQHLVNSMVVPVKGVVIWGVSDPKLFGYKQNLNILKDKKYLRGNQIDTWQGVVQNSEVFESPEVVYEKIINRYKAGKGEIDNG